VQIDLLQPCRLAAGVEDRAIGLKLGAKLRDSLALAPLGYFGIGAHIGHSVGFGGGLRQDGPPLLHGQVGQQPLRFSVAKHQTGPMTDAFDTADGLQLLLNADCLFGVFAVTSPND
jgi:hypothetical protein